MEMHWRMLGEERIDEWQHRSSPTVARLLLAPSHWWLIARKFSLIDSVVLKQLQREQTHTKRLASSIKIKAKAKELKMWAQAWCVLCAACRCLCMRPISCFLFSCLLSLPRDSRASPEKRRRKQRKQEETKIWMLMMKISQSFYFYVFVLGQKMFFPIGARLPILSRASFVEFLRWVRTPKATINYFYFSVKEKMIWRPLLRQSCNQAGPGDVLEKTPKRHQMNLLFDTAARCLINEKFAIKAPREVFMCVGHRGKKCLRS